MNKHLNQDELESLSKTVIFTRAARLNRWADLVGRHQRPICAIMRYEDLTEGQKASLPLADSPLGIAFGDPILSDAGLKDQTVHGAKNFFEISDEDLHHIVCSCDGRSTQPEHVAERIRSLAGQGAIKSAPVARRGLGQMLGLS